MAAAFGARGRMVVQPPTSREEAADEFGAAISEGAWREICNAFALHGERLADLEVTRGNDNKNDKRGWKRRKSDAEKGIENALSGLLKIDRDFLAEAADNVSSTGKAGIITGVLQHLDRAVKEIMFLSLIVRDAQPLRREIMTEAESRKALARDTFTALEGAGARLSNGWKMGQMEPSFADLSGFERLAELLQIHQGETPMASAKWLREALAQDK
ncbi:hypothetical protein [Cypionkella sp.]|uniref:hypothetical protein n=1 Tax=Cypionkella sp. TaxID=2811411 RepID=UPI00375011B2